jgi:outer membrane protein TolC
MRSPAGVLLILLFCGAAAEGQTPASGAAAVTGQAPAASTNAAAPFTLEAAYAAVHTASEAVRIKAIGVEKSRAEHDQAVSLALPRLSLDATGAYMTNPPGITVSRGALGSFATPLGTLTLPDKDIVFSQQNENTYFKIDATLSQPLFTWGKIAAAIRLAELAVEAAGSDLEKQQRDSEHDVHTAYFGALLAGRSEEELTSMRDILQGILKDRQKSFSEGTIIRQGVLEAESNLATLEKKLTDADESRLTAVESLGMLTGMDPRRISLATPFRRELSPLDEEVLKAEALDNSSDLQLARTRMSQARAKLDMEKGGAALLPDLALQVTLEVTGGRIPILGANWTDSWNANLFLGVGTKVKVLDSGESRAKITAAEKDMEAAAQGLSGAEKELRLSIRRGVQAARSAYAETREKSARLALAMEQEKNARISYDNGLATRNDLNSAELALSQSRLEDILAAYALEVTLGELEHLTGENFPR